MKKVIILSVLFLLVLSVSSVSVLAQEYPVLDKQVEIRQAHLEWQSKKLEVSMEATVDYIDEISNATGSPELSSTLQNYQNQLENALQLTTHVALNNALRQMKESVTQFRTQTRTQYMNHGGRLLQLRSRILTALNESEGEIDALEDAYWNKRKGNALDIFDLRAQRAQTVLDRLEENGYDITEAQAKLGEIGNKSSDLAAAYDSHNNTQIRQVNSDILGLSQELRQKVRDLQVTVPRRLRLRHWNHVAERVTTRSGQIIDELETLGMDVTQLRSILSDAEEDLETAKSEFEAGNMNGTADALRNVKAHMLELRDAYRNLVFGGALPDEILPEEMEAKLSAEAEAIDDTAKDMEDDV